MNIGIVGFGVVGQATARALTKHGHTVTTFDKVTGGNYDEVKKAEIIFICTPEKTVPEVVQKLTQEDKSEGILVVRSTVPPGTCAILSNQTKKPVFHNPEFLRESHALEDALNPPFIVVGGRGGVELETLVNLYSPFRKPIYTMSTTDSEMFKLWSNAKLACNISFANEMLQICRKHGANGHLINNVLTQTPLYPDHPWTIGGPYGGRCLPKDVKQLIVSYPNSVLLRAVEQVNRTV